MPQLSAAIAAVIVSTAVILAGAAPGALALQHVSDVPDLTGAWTLNEAMSEEVPLLPGEVTALARGAGVLPAVSLRRKSNTGLDLHEALRVRRALREMLASATAVTFTREGGRLVLSDSAGRATRFVPDGTPVRARHGGLVIELRARWQPPALVVERQFPDRTLVTERYTTFTDPRQLVITSTILNPRIDEPAATVMRVYDLVN